MIKSLTKSLTKELYKGEHRDRELAELEEEQEEQEEPRILCRVQKRKL